MFVEVPLLSRCCFCVPLRRGLLVWAYLKLVFNILAFGGGLMALWAVGVFLFFCDCVFYILALVFSAFMLLFFDIIFNFVLIVGCHKNHTTLLRLYYRFGMAHTVLFLTLSIITNAYIIYIARKPGNENSEIMDIVLILSPICFIMISLNMYLVMLVRSEILRLKPIGQFQFVNHIADSKCILQADFFSKDKSKEILSVKPSP